MPDPDTSTGCDQDLVFPGELPDLLHERHDHFPAVVHDSMPAYLNNIKVRKQADLFSSFKRPEQAFSYQ